MFSSQQHTTQVLEKKSLKFLMKQFRSVLILKMFSSIIFSNSTSSVSLRVKLSLSKRSMMPLLITLRLLFSSTHLILPRYYFISSKMMVTNVQSFLVR
jgi:hypothetical protein